MGPTLDSNPSPLGAAPMLLESFNRSPARGMLRFTVKAEFAFATPSAARTHEKVLLASHHPDCFVTGESAKSCESDGWRDLNFPPAAARVATFTSAESSGVLRCMPTAASTERVAPVLGTGANGDVQRAVEPSRNEKA